MWEPVLPSPSFPCAASSCSTQSPWPVLGQTLECGVLLQALEHVQGGAQLPGQPLTFLLRNWMSVILKNTAPEFMCHHGSVLLAWALSIRRHPSQVL